MNIYQFHEKKLIIMLQATTSTASTTTTTKFIKPSFVAPSQPLEKSLKDHIQRTAGLGDSENSVKTSSKDSTTSASSSKKGHKKDKRKSANVSSKEASPSEMRTSSK